MKKRLTPIFYLLISATLASAQNKTYFVSPSGNDTADGLSVKTTWKSIDKVNNSIFQPGDRVRFEGGQPF